MKLFKNKFSSQKGFTLIELLIVIAILGILAAAILVAINPVKKINQAKDSGIKSDIAQIATAMQAYYTMKGTTGTGTAYYPTSVLELKNAGELRTEPKKSDGSVYPVSCVSITGGCSDVAVGTALNDPAAAGNVWCWRSSTGLAAEVAAASCAAP